MSLDTHTNMKPEIFAQSIGTIARGDAIACITPMRDFHVLTWSYAEAANMLGNHIEEDGFYIDIAVHPICYLYRHSLELHLKQIVWDGRCLLGEEARIQQICNTHGLKPLWDETEKIMLSVWSDLPIPEEVFLLRQIVEWFQDCDPSSQSFRYPFNKKFQSSLSDKTHINLTTLKDAMKVANVFLNGVSGLLSEYMSEQRSLWSESGEW